MPTYIFNILTLAAGLASLDNIMLRVALYLAGTSKSVGPHCRMLALHLKDD